MTRKLDELGRIVIPKEIRNQYNLNEGDELEITEKNGVIILRKHKDVNCPLCSAKCEHTDNFCSKCGFGLKSVEEK